MKKTYHVLFQRMGGGYQGMNRETTAETLQRATFGERALTAPRTSVSRQESAGCGKSVKIVSQEKPSSQQKKVDITITKG